jgi:predicted 3-demethylubiquinone-9 3-methyltransferase (glyoxalase superfamily)
MRRVTPFLMFTGKAEEAMRFYAATFPRSRILSITRYGAAGPGADGTVHHAHLAIGELELRFHDSPPVHAFGFTPAISFFMDCDSAEEVRALAATLVKGGQVMMPANRYDFADMFAWVADRYGVSWQLSFTKA